MLDGVEAPQDLVEPVASDGWALSDWDFVVSTSDFPAAAVQLPGLVEPLDPLVQQWDRLSDTGWAAALNRI